MDREKLIDRLVNEVYEIQRDQALQKQVSALEQNKQLLSVSLNNSIHYANVVVMVGYAALFTIWQFSRDYLSKSITMWVGLLALSSVSFFVIYEIHKMYSLTQLHRHLGRILEQEIPPQDRISVRQSVIATWTKREQAIWPYYFYPALMLGISAAVTLCCNFAVNLIFEVFSVTYLVDMLKKALHVMPSARITGEIKVAIVTGVLGSLIAAFITWLLVSIITKRRNRKDFAKASGVYTGYGLNGVALKPCSQSECSIWYIRQQHLGIKVTHYKNRDDSSDFNMNDGKEKRSWEGLIMMVDRIHGSIAWKYTEEVIHQAEFGFKRCIFELGEQEEVRKVLLIDDFFNDYGKEVFIRKG